MADNTPSPKPRPVPRPRPRSLSSTHLSTANADAPPPPIRARSVTSVIPPTPTQRHLSIPEKPPVARRSSTAEVVPNLDAIERKDTLKSAGDVVLRQSVTTSYGVNKAFQRPRSQVKRKTYLEAKLEREEEEKRLEETRIQAEIAEKEAITLAEKEEAEQQEREAQEQLERQQRTVDDTHAAANAHNPTSHDNAYNEDLPSDPEPDEDLPPPPSNIDHDVSSTTNITDDNKEEEVVEPQATPGDDNSNNANNNNSHTESTINDDTTDDNTTDPTPNSNDNDGTDISGITHNTDANTDEGADTSEVTPSPPTVISATLRAKLNLGDAEITHYERFWATVDKEGEVVTAAGVVPFFKASNLGNKVLRKIWNQCDVDPPHGQLNKDEFMMACKLIALQQAKLEATMDNIAAKADPPTIGHLADPVPLLVNARKPWLTKDATDDQCLAAVQESGPGSWIIQKLGNAEVKLFGNQDGVSKQSQISFGVREGHKCYMTSTGKIFSTLKELVDAAKENPSIIKWSDEDTTATMAFEKPAVFSQVVADMATRDGDDNIDNENNNSGDEKHGANADGATANNKKDLRKETSGSVMDALTAGFGGDDDNDGDINVDGDGSKSKLAAPNVDVDGVAAVNETPEMKMQRIIAEAEAKIMVAQQQHERAVQEYMNSKLLDEWNAGGRSHKNTKHDKKELKRVLDDPALANPTVYAAAVVCETFKPKDLKKFYLTIQSGEKIEILECSDTPAGLWVARHPWKSKVLAFVHTRHIMIDAADVQRIHLGDISMASTPASSPTKSPSKQSLSSISSPPPPTISEDDEGVEETHTSDNNADVDKTSRHVTLAFAEGDRPKLKLAEDAKTDKMLNDIYASSDEEDAE
eukprot:m.23696 g.23696  ORF g.23696 m.23696 type:complete len:868 (+) comp14319_c0_seq1:348-2951(+)